MIGPDNRGLFSSKKSFRHKLFCISFLPGLCTILLLTVVFFPMMEGIARENDASYEQAMLYALSAQFERVNESAENMKRKLESSG